MKKSVLILLVASITLGGLGESARAGRSITLPFEANFELNNYSDLFWLEGGESHHIHLPSGGWDGGGCAKIIPPDEASEGQGNTGLGAFHLPAGSLPQVLHIRVLVKVGPTYEDNPQRVGYGYQNKFIIVQRESGDRGMTIFERCNSVAYCSNHYYTFGACTDNSCDYHCGTGEPDCGWPNGNDAFKSTDYEGEWFCLELKLDNINHMTSVSIWTRDGSLSGQYMERSLGSGSAWSTVQIIGGFYNGWHPADDNTYVLFDELKMDDEFIGPPAGFIGGHKADLNDDGVINMPELMVFIGRWKVGDGVTKAEVEEARDIWFSGGVY